ncbi:MAG: polymorphic toxin-type HINT domain-containing protein [Pirellula sp.]
MAVAFWLGRFFSKLQWNLANASKRERRYAKMQRRARRKQDGLASQLEDLEYRVMLSGTTAVNDQAVLNQIGVPITLDVLSNDVSGNGALDIVSASIVGGSGTVIIVEGNSAASGAAARDRVQVTLTSNFTGNATVQYTIRDASGQQSSANATVSVGSAPGTTINSSGGGALSVNGGTGNGHVATPTSSYIPTVSGNYTYTVGVAGAAYNANGASGTQGLTSTITTTSNGVANWSYSELVVWTYNINSNDGAGNSKHLWGGYSYLFTSASVAGVITTTLAYVGTDNYDGNVATNTSGSSFSSHYWGQINTTITVINIDAVLDSGSIYYHKNDTANSLGGGSYSRPMPGGIISGTMESDSYEFNSITMTRAYTQLTTGGFYVAGIVSMNGNSNKSFEYSGGGTYGDASMTTTVTESGGQSENSSYMGGGSFTNIGGWVLTGTGYTLGDHFSKYSYIGTGSYSREFHGGTMIGTQNTNGHNDSSGDFRVDYSLGNNGWSLISGGNHASGDSLSHFDYAGSGGYTFTQSSSGYSQTLSGSMSEDGHNTNRSNYGTTGTLNVSTMQWSYTGTGSGSGDNHDHLHYEGSGSYYRQIHGGSVSGSANEEYDHFTQGSFKNSSTLLPTGWVTTGSGSAKGTSMNHTDYDGAGNYSRTEGAAPNTITYNGTQKQDGHSTVNQNWKTSSVLDATGLITTNGEGSGTTSTHSYTYFSGSAAYARPTSDGLGTISGSKNEEREDYDFSVANTQTVSFDQEYGALGQTTGSGSIGTGWSTTTGSASANGNGFANTNWSGEANYSKSWTKSEGNATSTFTGSVETKEKGHVKSNYSASSKSTLDTQGNWIRTSGSGSSSGNNFDYIFNKTTGSYVKTTTGANDNESTYSGAFMNSNKAENHSDWSESNTVAGGVFVQTAGNGSGSGDTETISSNSGTGSYSHNGGAYNSHISGTVNEDNYSRDATKYSTSSTWSASSGWTTTGSSSGEGNSRNHNDYTGSGRMNTINSLSSGYDGSSGTTGLMGSVNENGHTNSNSQYSSVSTWNGGNTNPSSGQSPTEAGWKLQSGAGSSWGDGLTHIDWDGTGSYASGGSDNRWGTWSVSGTTTSKGHDNKNNKWDKSSVVQLPASGTEKQWVTVSGSASDWGDSLKETTHSGSGSWSAWVVNGSLWPLYSLIPATMLAGAYRVSGTVTQKGSEKDTDEWKTSSTLQLNASGQDTGASGGDNWKVDSGSSSGTSHMDNRDQFGYSSSNYVVSGNSWMTGHMSAYGFNEVIEDADWKSTWSQSVATENPDGSVTVAPGWKLVSGSGRVDETSGSGKEYSGSGTQTLSGTNDPSNGGATWSFSAFATQSGKQEDNSGIFVETAVQNGEWAVTDSGLTASGFAEQRWKWDGSGSYNRGPISGKFFEGDKGFAKDVYSFEWTSTGAVTTADRDEEWDKSGYSNYSASGTDDLLGVTGRYNEKGNSNWSSSGTVDYDWDTSLPETWYEQLVGENHDQWVSKSGTAKDITHVDGSNDFVGNATVSASGGGTTFMVRSFANAFHEDSTENYSVVVQQPIFNIPEDGRELGWNLTGGTFSDGGSGNFDTLDDTDGPYITPIYLIDGTYNELIVTHSDYTSNRTSTFSSGSGWNTTGSGTRNSWIQSHYEYEGSESFATNGGSGTRSEELVDNWFSSETIKEEWVDQAGGGRPSGGGLIGAGGRRNHEPNIGISGGYWSMSGTASGTADGTWKVELNKTENWSTVVHGALISGTQTTDYSEDYEYNSNAGYILRNGSTPSATDDYFELVSGGGSGDGNGHQTITGSASGAYSSSFDYGAGTITGFAKASKRDHWDYTYHQDLSLEAAVGGGKNWVLSASGRTNFDGFSKWDYAGSGGYDVTTTHANGYNRTSATVVESGHNNYNYSGSDVWNNNTWDYNWVKWGDSANENVYTRYSEYSSTYSYNQDGHNDTSTSYGHANLKEESRSVSNFRETYVEKMAATTGLTWTRAGSGAYSSEHIVDSDSYGIYSWDNNYTSPNYTSFSTGYSSVSTDNYDKWVDWSNSNWTIRHDGSSEHTGTSGGSHTWSMFMSMSFNMSWGETWSYGGGSGSGYGGGSSTGGTSSGTYSSGSSSGTSWSYPMNWSTPANPPSSGGGGPIGDGKTRWAAVNMIVEVGSPLVLPNAAPPFVAAPDLSRGGLTEFETLGAKIWKDLSTAEAFWNGVDAVEDAFAWAGDQVTQLFDNAARWIEDAGVWATETFGWSGFEIAGSFLAGFTRGVGEALGSMVDIPGMLHSAVDTLSNLSASDILDGVQGVLDVVGLVPGLGEIADGINGVISLARGDYVGAALSFTSMIPIVGDAIGKGGKAARFIANKADDVMALGRQIKCKVTGTGCFVAGTKVWLSATVDLPSLREGRAQRWEGVASIALAPTRTITKRSIESVAIGSRVSGDNPRPWDFDGELAVPDQSTWMLAKFSLQKESGNWVDVEMIRPAEYWESQQAAPGSLIFMEFPELEASGMAQVRSIEPCPPIAEGSGNLVTARIVTRQVSELVEIGFDDDELLTGTPQHPIWSIERQDWVELGDLEIGEHLWTEDGPVEVQSKRLLTTGESVYNLEVHGHHIYQVGELGVLVHNAKLTCNAPSSAVQRTNGQLVQDIATRAEAWGVRRGLSTTGSVEGTLKHGYADRLLTRYQEMFGSRGLSTEVRYANGVPWREGVPLKGTIRLDVVEGPLNNPTAIFDYKFGNAILSPNRINQIRNGAGLGPNVPVLPVRP